MDAEQLTPETSVKKEPNCSDNLPDAIPPKPTDPSNDEWKKEFAVGASYEKHCPDIIKLLTEFQDMWSGKLGNIKAAKHRINIPPDSKPVHQQPYRSGIKNREREKKDIQEMLDAKVIEPSESEYASPIVYALKSDGSLRFCIDYRRLNQLTVRDAYPIPRMDECIDSLGEAKIFSTLDANSGYWQIEIDPADRHKSAFTTHHGLYQFIRMPFGLKNAPATFQRACDIILSGVKWQFALVYIDDVIIYSRTVEEHKKHLQIVLSLLKTAGVTLNLKKCTFFSNEVSYLGHTIRPGKLHVLDTTTKAVQRAHPH